MIEDTEYFAPQISLWGETVQYNLKSKKIVIIGCGGLGSTVSMLLGSSGVGEIHLVDFDTVNTYNIHRQIAFKISDNGKYKCKQLAKLLKSRYDGVDVKAHIESFEQFSKKIYTFDLIIDATDNFTTKKEIDDYAKSKKIPWLYGATEGCYGYVCLFDKIYFKIFKISHKRRCGTIGPVVSLIASLQANYALRYLVGLPIEKDIFNCLFFDKVGSLCYKKFNIRI